MGITSTEGGLQQGGSPSPSHASPISRDAGQGDTQRDGILWQGVSPQPGLGGAPRSQAGPRERPRSRCCFYFERSSTGKGTKAEGSYK